MAGFRIDINDARNAPVKPLEPPGGGAVPVTGTAQVNDETNTARTIGDVVTAGPHEGIEATYDAAARAVRLRLTGSAQPGAMSVGSDGDATDDWLPIPGPPGPPGPAGTGSGIPEHLFYLNCGAVQIVPADTYDGGAHDQTYSLSGVDGGEI
jgi:hypothetical protein